MAPKKKKIKRPQTPTESKPMTPVVISPKIDYNQPLSSPYESRFITLTIGNKVYKVPEEFLCKYPQLQRLSFISSEFALTDVFEDAGHTLVHFLYSGNYETTHSPPDVDTCGIAGEYRRSILVYHASVKYGLPGLESLARHYIEYFGEELSLYEVLRLTRDVFSALPGGETWLPNYIKGHLLRLMVGNLNANLIEFYSVLGHDHHFDITVMKMVVDMLSVHCSDNALKEEEPAVQEPVVHEPVVHEPVVHEPVVHEPVVHEPVVHEPVVHEPVVHEPVVHEPVVEEPVVHETVVEEPVVHETVDEEPAFEEAVVGEPTFEEPVVEEPVDEEPVVGEPVVQEPVVQEPAFKEPVVEEPVVEEPVDEEPVVGEPVAGEPVFEEPVSEEPFFEEPVVGKPVFEEPVVQEPVEHWGIPGASFVEGEGLPDAPLPLHEAPAAGNLFNPEAPLVEASSEAQPEKNYPTRIPVADLALYANWGKLNLKVRTSRTKRLAKRGLPIPSEDGVVEFDP